MTSGPGGRPGLGPWGLGGYAAALGAGLCWSTTGLFVRLLGRQGMDPFLTTFARAMVAAVLIALGSAVFDRRLLQVRGRDLPGLLALGIASVGFSQATFIYCIAHIPLAIGVVLNYTNPMFVALIAWLVFRQRLGWRHVLAVGLTMVGVILVTGLLGGRAAPAGPAEAATAGAVAGVAGSGVGAGSLPPLAVAAGLLSGLGYAVYTVAADRVMKNRSPLALHFWVMGLGGVALFAVLVLVRVPLTWRASAPGCLELLGLGAGPGVLGFYLFITGVRAIAPHRAAIVATIEPVAVAVWGYVAFGETLTGLQVLGMVLVIAAIVLVSLRQGAAAAVDPHGHAVPGRAAPPD